MYKINSKWNRNLNVKLKTSEENVGENLCDLKSRQRFFKIQHQKNDP